MLGTNSQGDDYLFLYYSTVSSPYSIEKGYFLRLNLEAIMLVTIKPDKPINDAKAIELLFEIAKAFADMDFKDECWEDEVK